MTKTYWTSIAFILIFAGLTYFHFMPLWAMAAMDYFCFSDMAKRSTAKKDSVKLEAIEKKEFTVTPDRGVHRLVRL